MKVEVYCPYCGVLCVSEKEEVRKVLFEKGKYHVNMTCWSCKKVIPEITIFSEEEGDK